MKQKSAIYWLLAGLWLSIGLGLLFAILLLWGLDYASFTRQTLEYVGKTDWRDYFEQQVFPPSKFVLSRYLAITTLIAYLLSSFFVWSRFSFWAFLLRQSLSDFWTTTQRKWQGLRRASKAEKLALCSILFILLLRSLHNLYINELQYDEAWTYNHFVSKGILISAISPNNNHIFFSILASITSYLPIETKYSLRLVAWLAGGGACLIFYGLTRSLWGWRIAIISLIVFAFSSAINSYMLYARGYSLMLFFGLLALWASLGILLGKGRGLHWIVFGIAMVLGGYSTMAYIYQGFGLAAVFGFCLFWERRWPDLRRWFLVNSTAITVLLVLHLPLLLTNGFSVLMQAGAAGRNPKLGAQFWYYINRVSDWWLMGRGWPVYWIILLWLGLLAFVLWKYKKRCKIRYLLVLAIFNLLMPTYMFWLMRAEVPLRLWCFESIYIALSIAVLCGLIRKQIEEQKLLFIGLLVCIFALFFTMSQVHYFTSWSRDLDIAVRKEAELLIEHNIEECYNFARYEKPLLHYYYLSNGKKLRQYMPFEESKDYQPFAERAYEAVLLDRDDYQPSAEDMEIIARYSYKPIYEDQRITIYLYEPR